MKSFCWLAVLFATVLAIRSSALAAGQGVLAKFRQLPAVELMSGNLKEGVNLIRRAALRTSVTPDSNRDLKHQLFAAVAGMSLIWGAYTADAACPGCGDAPPPQWAMDNPKLRFSPLWHGNLGFPAIDDPSTKFSDHYALVPREGVEFINFVINKIDVVSSLGISMPDKWLFATDDVDGDGQTNVVAWYYNNGWQRIEAWDNVDVFDNSMQGQVQPDWFNMPGGGSWDGVQVSVQVTGRANYVFEGRPQHEQIMQGKRPTFNMSGGLLPTHDGDRAISFSLTPQIGDDPPTNKSQHRLIFRFIGFLPGDTYNDGFFSDIDLTYMGWRVWWGWNHFVQGGKDNYIWDYNEDGSIDQKDYDELNNFLANNRVFGAPAAVLASGGLAPSPPPKVEVFPKGDNGTSIMPIKKPANNRPVKKMSTTWGELKRQ